MDTYHKSIVFHDVALNDLAKLLKEGSHICSSGIAGQIPYKDFEGANAVSSRHLGSQFHCNITG